MKKKFTRVTAFLVVVMFIFSIIISRLIYVQIINGDYYSQVAQAMGEKPIYSFATRGELLDANHVKIATNRLSYSIVYSSQQKRQSDEELNKSLINAVNIIYSNNDQSCIITNSLPIIYDDKSKTFRYKFNTSNTIELVNNARSFKNKYNIKTDFDKNFNYDLIDNFQKKYSNDQQPNTEPTNSEIEDFENKYLKDFDENKDIQEVINQLAGKYNFLNADSSGKIENKYNLSEEEIFDLVALRTSLQSITYSLYKDVDLAKDVKQVTAWEIQVKNIEVPGITSQVVPIRYYPFGEVGSNFIGYLGKISNGPKYSNLGYDINRELIGVSGLEYELENMENNDLNIQLRGQPGIKYVNVDKYGKVIEETGEISPVPGDTVVTTIDMGLQKAAEYALDSTMKDLQNGKFGKKYPNATRGAIVVMDINNGAVLALVSRPGLNPNDFAETGAPKDPSLIKKYMPDTSNDEYQLTPLPMLDYATAGTAPPGSTFKPLTAIAGLQEGEIDRNTEINDTGIYTKDGADIKCWVYDETGRGHGKENVVTALQNSCNFFFNEVGHRLGFPGLTKWASLFGLTRDLITGDPQPTGIEIYEEPGIVGDQNSLNLKAVNSAMGRIIDKLQQLKYGGYTLDYSSYEYQAIKNMLLSGKYDLTNEADKQEVEGKLDSECGITNKNAVIAIENEMKYIKSQTVSPVEVLRMAMGQGKVALTPLQMAQMMSTIVNGGTRYQAHLVKEVLNPDGSVKEEIKPQILNKIELNPLNVAAVMEGMAKVDSEGTAASIFRNYPVKTGGKTGTAESGYSEDSPRQAYGWFLGVAPLDKPQIVVSAVIYDAGHGIYAGEAVKGVYDYYFRNVIQSLQNTKQ